MNPPRPVPVIPESAPFSPEQRAWLNGFLAGLFSYTHTPPTSPTPAPPPNPQTLNPLAILVGSQTGTAEKLAKRIAKSASQRGFAPVIHDLAKFDPSRLAQESAVLVVTSTYGDGEPPDNAKGFWSALRSPDAPRLNQTRFSICALGDTQYPRFCQFGRDLDARLETLGAQRVHPRQDCDIEFDRPFAAWLGPALDLLAPTHPPAPAQPQQPAIPEPIPEPDSDPAGTRDNPIPASLTHNRRLTAPGADKDVRHFALELGPSAPPYQAGDALGVWPTNDPALVRLLLDALEFSGSEPVPDRHGNPIPIEQALIADYDITRIPRSLLNRIAPASRDPDLIAAAAPDANGALERFLRGKDVLDLVTAHPSLRFEPADFIACLRRIQPRLYSIASSPRLHPSEIHLCVNVVRFTADGRPRTGLASGCLADRTPPNQSLPVYLHENPAFRPPPPDRRLIMIGPGTGIAPFRAFLQDRQALGAQGPNWLFFGDQHESTGFLYREDLTAWRDSGLLNRLDLAWSRDQSEKIYVQHRMLQQARDLWAWIDDGASIHVCGDASRMARDVDDALHQIIRQEGGKSPEAAADYVRSLVSDRRYCRDVY